MRYLQFIFESVSEEQQAMLVALLSEQGFNGFEQGDKGFSGFIEEQQFDQDSFDELIKQLPVSYSVSTIESTNWNAEWESGFEPVTVLDPITALPFASIRAGFHAPENRLIHELIITPKMSFGTGHHATTYLMIERMSQLNLAGQSVIDYGTGTGVLAILAEKMGAASVIAIDYDEWSINNAMENIAVNGCEKIRLVNADTIDADNKAGVVLANINRNIILENMPAIIAAAEDGATILLSGILVVDKEIIVAALTRHFAEIVGCYEKEHWLCIEAICKK